MCALGLEETESEPSAEDLTLCYLFKLTVFEKEKMPYHFVKD